MSQHRHAIIALLTVVACTCLGVLSGVTRDDAFERQWRGAPGGVGAAATSGGARRCGAYGVPSGAGGWSRLADVGDAPLRIGDAPALQPSAAGAARQSYLT